MLMVTVDGHGSGYREISVTADDIFFFFFKRACNVARPFPAHRWRVRPLPPFPQCTRGVMALVDRLQKSVPPCMVVLFVHHGLELFRGCRSNGLIRFWDWFDWMDGWNFVEGFSDKWVRKIFPILFNHMIRWFREMTKVDVIINLSR